jgi:hypothetical protein
VHPCAVHELLVDPLPEGASRDGALYPDGAHLTDLKEVRDLLYKMQRPAIAPSVSFFFSLPYPLSSPLTTFVDPLLRARSWCTRTTGKRKISSCSIIVACCIRSLVRSDRIRSARSTSVILRRRATLLDLRRRM